MVCEDLVVQKCLSSVSNADVQAHAAVIFNSGNKKYCDLMQKYLDKHINSQQRDNLDTEINLTRIRMLIDNELKSQN